MTVSSPAYVALGIFVVYVAIVGVVWRINEIDYTNLVYCPRWGGKSHPSIACACRRGGGGRDTAVCRRGAWLWS